MLLPVPASRLGRFLALWGPVLVWAAVVFGLSSTSDLPAPPSGLSDKHLHIAAYAVGGALTVRALALGRWPGATWRNVWVAAGLVTLYGVSDEIHQAFVPGRDASAADVAADAVGAVAGGLATRACAIIAAARAGARSSRRDREAASRAGPPTLQP